MDLRPPARLSAALLLAAALGGCRPPARPLVRGSALELKGAPADGVSLVWVVPAAEFRVCAPVAGSLRGLQRPSAAALPLSVVYVGPHPEWMEAYLRAQRLRARLVALTADEYAARFGAAPIHALYRVRGGRVEDALSPGAPGWDGRLRTFAAPRSAGTTAETPPGERPHG
jgi:hypothetical protein